MHRYEAGAAAVLQCRAIPTCPNQLLEEESRAETKRVAKRCPGMQGTPRALNAAS